MGKEVFNGNTPIFYERRVEYYVDHPVFFYKLSDLAVIHIPWVIENISRIGVGGDVPIRLFDDIRDAVGIHIADIYQNIMCIAALNDLIAKISESCHAALPHTISYKVGIIPYKTK